MAEASLVVDQELFACPICLEILNDPVTTSCGHSFCSMCINNCWDQDDESGLYNCPQCRETVTPRPVLRRNNMLAEVVEKLKRSDLQTTSSPCYAEPEDVDCDFCTGKKYKAIKSCLVCVVSLCETHVKPHLELPALKKHTLVHVIKKLDEKLCSIHGKLMEIYCRSDQSCICYMCMLDKHKGHDTVSAEAERYKKQCEVKETQVDIQKKIQEKEKNVQELKQAMDDIKISAQATVDNTEKIFAELISSMKKKCLGIIEMVRDQERAELSEAEEIVKRLEQEISDLMREVTNIEELSKTHDHINFLQSFQSLLSSGCKDTPFISVNQHLMFDRVTESVSYLKKQIEEFSNEKFIEISKNAAAVRILLPLEPKSREDFLQYFCELTLDPCTANSHLILCEKNKVVTCSGIQQPLKNDPERFDQFQVLCKERMSGRSYWEVEWSGHVYLSVSYNEIGRKNIGGFAMCTFGWNCQSWSLECTTSYLRFWHDNIKTELSTPSDSRIGLYVDHSAGILSFYSISDTMKLLHSIQTTFTQPLYAGLRLSMTGSTARLCDPKFKYKLTML